MKLTPDRPPTGYGAVSKTNRNKLIMDVKIILRSGDEVVRFDKFTSFTEQLTNYLVNTGLGPDYVGYRVL